MLGNRLRLQGLQLLTMGARAESGVAQAWTPDSKRTGALAMKVGMIPVWDKWGKRHPITVLQMDDCEVVQVKTEEIEGYNALQLGVGEAKEKNVNRAMLHHYKKQGVKPKRKLMEFRVSKEGLLPVGTQLSAAHFVPGQTVDVSGKSKGKGFQGVMKRHHYAGGTASHGNSKNHRTMGSTGMCQDPGRVFKGKKMPGRMGGTNNTIANLWVYKVELDRNLLYVKGAVPGPPGSFVRVTDSRKHRWDTAMPPPFPTIDEEGARAVAEEVAWEAGDGREKTRLEWVAEPGDIDPFDYTELSNPFKN